jgi:hypothetical protein|tara:strand:+ start:300 stop:494 length:195 start_codon:yes stop_codon:yes gene_type:complete
MLDIETYKKIDSGKLASFVFVIPKKRNSFTYYYVAKNEKDAIVRLMQDYDIEFDMSKGHRLIKQ